MTATVALSIGDQNLSLQIGDQNEVELDPLLAQKSDSFYCHVKLHDSVPSPYITIQKDTNGETQFSTKCEGPQCDVTAYIISKDNSVSIRVKVCTALKGFNNFWITQPINYTSEEPDKCGQLNLLSFKCLV